MTFTLEDWDDWKDWHVNPWGRPWSKKRTATDKWLFDGFPRKDGAGFDETESPLLRDWARGGSDLDRPFPQKQERMSIFSSIEDQEAQVLELQLNIAKQRALTAPIRILPPEILSVIFVEADQSSDDDSCRKAILRCCRKWQQIGLTTPSFWSLIRIAVKNPNYHQVVIRSCPGAGKVKHCLKLAGTAMLDIAIGSHSHADMQNCEVVELLSEQSSQIRSIKTRKDIGGLILAGAFQKSDDLPNLVSIIAQTEFPENFMTIHKNKSLKLSGLQSLLIRGYTLGDMSKITYPRLTTLHIDLPTMAETTPKSFWKFLTGMPKLQNLKGRFSASSWDSGYKRLNLSFPNLTALDLTNKPHDGSRNSSWPDTPGNYILIASPKVTTVEIVLDDGITSLPPPVPVAHVTTVFFKIEGSTRGKPPIATRRKRIRDWLDVFPAVRHLKIHDRQRIHDRQTNKGAKGSEFINVLLESTAKRGHLPCCPSATHIELTYASLNHDTLLKFSRSRSLVSEGGALKDDTSRPVAKCVITLSKCADIRDVDSANADMLLAAMIPEEPDEARTSREAAARVAELTLERDLIIQDWEWGLAQGENLDVVHCQMVSSAYFQFLSHRLLKSEPCLHTVLPQFC